MLTKVAAQRYSVQMQKLDMIFDSLTTPFFSTHLARMSKHLLLPAIWNQALAFCHHGFQLLLMLLLTFRQVAVMFLSVTIHIVL